MIITITGMNYYHGMDFLKPGMKVTLRKEPDNKHDTEAIMVKMKGLGKIGYVANSPYTVVGESWSAGRLYDKIGDTAKGKTLFSRNGTNFVSDPNGWVTPAPAQVPQEPTAETTTEATAETTTNNKQKKDKK